MLLLFIYLVLASLLIVTFGPICELISGAFGVFHDGELADSFLLACDLWLLLGELAILLVQVSIFLFSKVA